MTTAENKDEHVKRGPDRREGEERRKSPRISFEESERRKKERRTIDDRRQG